MAARHQSTNQLWALRILLPNQHLTDTRSTIQSAYSLHMSSSKYYPMSFILKKEMRPYRILYECFNVCIWNLCFSFVSAVLFHIGVHLDIKPRFWQNSLYLYFCMNQIKTQKYRCDQNKLSLFVVINSIKLFCICNGILKIGCIWLVHGSLKDLLSFKPIVYLDIYLTYMSYFKFIFLKMHGEVFI